MPTRLLLILALLLPACSREPAPAVPEGTLRVVATTAMIADPTRHIAGDRASVTSLMGEGVDPHLFRPARSDMTALLAADLVLANGHYLEGRMDDAFRRLADRGTPVVRVAEAVDQSILLDDPDEPDQLDPHLWMDPLAWLEVTNAIAEALADLDPDHADTYRANAGAYQQHLRALHAWADAAVATIPESQRVLVTAHDAFNYFADRYHIEVHAIQGLSTESEAGVRDIERLVTLLVDRRIPAVFTETSVSDRNIRALIAGAQARGHDVALGGSLYSDAMGPADTKEGTYLGMIEHNVRTIVEALGGNAPPFEHRPESP
ncbi:MAG: zinc ABC transporter substrate-binding protein [Phycisphaerales bacterium]|nr:zinc ABC transporter substrate-binding protein [Planctomycetota bacterium]MCH8507562.1 zinc ABC transporter substrate-binding protein [Phycisphaerales bacterium]